MTEILQTIYASAQSIAQTCLGCALRGKLSDDNVTVIKYHCALILRALEEGTKK